MSFVKKAVKKVFKVVKKIGKVVKKVVKSKWFKIALIAAAVVFTAGVASGAFATAGGFSGLMKTAALAGKGTIGSFFSAVGQTMSMGLSSIVGAVKSFGTAAKSALMGGQATTPAVMNPMSNLTLANAGSLNASINLAVNPGLMTSSLAPVVEGGAGLLVQGMPATVGKSLLSRIGSAFMANTVGGSMLRTGLVMGIQGYMQGKQREEEEDLRKSQWSMGADAKGNTFDFGSLGFAQSTATQPLWKTSMESGGVGFQQPNASTQNVSLGAPTPQQQAQAAEAPPPPNEGQYDAALLAHQAPQANPAAPPPQGTPQGRGPSLLDLETMGVA